MSKPSAKYLSNQYAQGVPMRMLCAKHGLTMVELRSLLGLPPIGRRKGPRKDRERLAAIAELKAEGYGDEQIRAVFGN